MILPRQARDKHMESTQQEMRFSQADKTDDEAGNERDEMDEFVFEFFLHKYGAALTVALMPCMPCAHTHAHTRTHARTQASCYVTITRLTSQLTRWWSACLLGCLLGCHAAAIIIIPASRCTCDTVVTSTYAFRMLCIAMLHICTCIG